MGLYQSNQKQSKISKVRIHLFPQINPIIYFNSLIYNTYEGAQKMRVAVR